MSDFLTAADAARILDVSPTAIASLCRRGHFPGAVRESWGPGFRWLVPRSQVSKRLRLKKSAKLPKGGNPNMVPGNDLWRLRKKVSKTASESR